MARPEPPPAAFVLGLYDSGLAVVRSLGHGGVPLVGFDDDPRAPGLRSRFCEGRVSGHPRREPERLLRDLRAARAGLDVAPVLLPTSDATYGFLVAHRDALAPDFRLGLPPEPLASALLEKRGQYELAGRHGLRHPRSFYPESADDVRRIREDVPYPALVKPLAGHVWRETFRGERSKGLKVGSPRELEAAFDLVRGAGQRALVQEVVPGPITSHFEICVHLGAGGAVLGEFTARKLRQYPVEFGVGTLVESVDDPQLSAVAVRFLRAIGYRGFANVELKRDARDGELTFIEVNPRFHLQASLPAECGIDFARIAYLDALGRPPPPPTRFRAGVRWWNLRCDVRSFWAQRRSGALGVAGWVGSWLGARSFASLAADDPEPCAYLYASRLADLLRGRARADPGLRARAARRSVPG